MKQQGPLQLIYIIIKSTKGHSIKFVEHDQTVAFTLPLPRATCEPEQMKEWDETQCLSEFYLTPRL